MVWRFELGAATASAFFGPRSDAKKSPKMPASAEAGMKEPATRSRDIRETARLAVAPAKRADRAVVVDICLPTGRCAGSAGESHFLLTIGLF